MSGTSFATITAGAAIKRSATLSASTAGQAPGDAVWITSAGTFDLTFTLPDASTLGATGSGASTNPTILPIAATNYVVNTGTVTVKNVWVTRP